MNKLSGMTEDQLTEVVKHAACALGEAAMCNPDNGKICEALLALERALLDVRPMNRAIEHDNPQPVYAGSKSTMRDYPLPAGTN